MNWCSRLLKTTAEVTGMSLTGDLVQVHAVQDGNEIAAEGDICAVAVPPRLACGLSYQPSLPEPVMGLLGRTPTWMAPHAKVLAVYEQPFWCHQGLSGGGLSMQGPLAEFHDASPSDGEIGAILGFVKFDAAKRESLGKQALEDLVIRQLGALFGPDGANPLSIHMLDWSNETHCASPEDRKPVSNPSLYGRIRDWTPIWDDRLHFIATEASRTNGGLMEGAIESALLFCDSVTQTGKPGAAQTTGANPRTANMSWEFD
ncbi:flavin monoamine oxidase family protein [Methylophilus rhizosphaerae]|uniref:flavin monoamine oxidase family protein n=1 Tax=Methylophilus rhizosphaerae TaxID=492660 RepID=UPI002480C168|nr:FAD-dependent oxidoreductase [Methylophilus rhizosphaerae]